jgi:hypothetical protein
VLSKCCGVVVRDVWPQYMFMACRSGTARRFYREGLFVWSGVAAMASRIFKP